VTETAPQLSIVLPAHNEIALLGSTVTNLTTGLDERGLSYEIIVVENGSGDGTLRLARLLSAQLAELRVITLPVGDYGAALAAGFAAARGTYVVNFDVDYYDLTFLDAALAALESKRAAIVVASKRAPGASDRRPLIRRLLTLGFATASRLTVGLEASDAHGMKAMQRDLVAPVVERCVMHGSLFDVEMVVRAGSAGLQVDELPAVVVERRSPRTPVWSRSVESLIGLVRLGLVLRREERTALPAGERRRLLPGSRWRALSRRGAGRSGGGPRVQ
jgi:hypothetical protein